MKIALFGYGRMGREIERLAREMGHTVVATFDPVAPGATDREVTAGRVAEADVCLDFSRGDAVLSHVRVACEARKPIVVGTTAWEADLAEASRLVETAGTALIHAPNFAIGVQVAFRLVGECARLLDAAAGDCDVSIHEIHHRGKADSPSGTAKRLAALLLEGLRAKDTVVTGAPGRAMAPNEIHVTAQRVGVNPGTHIVTFDLGDETLEIRHAARGRAIFARGALKAAEWIVGRKGVYSFDEVLKTERQPQPQPQSRS